MRRLLIAVALGLATLLAAPGARADGDSATHYYLSLGDSLAAGFQPNGDLTHGYAEQLYATLVADDPKLKLEKLGCSGESTKSMLFGSQPRDVVFSCGTPRFYKSRYAKGTQLAEAVSFLQAHKGKVALVTIDIGSNDLQRFDAQGNVVICLLEGADCDVQGTAMSENLAAILAELRSAAGPGIPIVGMTYYNPLAVLGVPAIDAEVDELNGRLTSTYAAAGAPVADVAGAFHNGEQPLSAHLVCAWTWFCSLGDGHLNTTGYGVVANEFLEVIQP